MSEAAPLHPAAPRCHRVPRHGDPAPATIEQASEELIELVRAAGALTVDVETSGFPVGHVHHELRTVQLGNAEVAYVLDVREGEGADPVRALVRDFMAVAPKLHAHSATADLVPMQHAGLCDESAWQRMHDTVIPAKLADPASTGSDPGLKELSKTMLDGTGVSADADQARRKLFKAGKWLTNTKPTTPLERSGWAQVDPADPVMLAYAAADVLDTAALVQAMPELDGDLIERERAVQAITARLAHRGMRVDPDAVRELREAHAPAEAEAAQRIRALGIDNPASDRQIAQWLVYEGAPLPATDKGNPSIAGDVLEGLRDAPGSVGQMVDAVLTYREHSKALGTFIEPYAIACEHGDGRVYPTVYTLQADTGRMSCVRPNLQQVPREGGFRRVLTADPGHLLISADFSSVELRVAAALSGDANLRAMIEAGTDLHMEVARQVWGPQATKGDRYTAKRIVFGRMYGGGVATLAKQARQPEHIVQQALDTLDAMTPQLAAWTAQWREAVRSGLAPSFTAYSGRPIHLQREYPHKAVNFLIQGTGRELFVDALLRWADTPYGGGVVLPVHDEIVAVVPEHQAEAATVALVECMTTELFGVDIVAEADAPTFAWQDAA